MSVSLFLVVNLPVVGSIHGYVHVYVVTVGLTFVFTVAYTTGCYVDGIIVDGWL